MLTTTTTTTNERETLCNKKNKKKQRVVRALSRTLSAFCPPRTRKVSSSLLMRISSSGRKREKRERKFLGFYIKWGFKAILWERILKGKLPHYYLSLRGPRARDRSEKRNRREAFICLSVYLVLCFVPCALLLEQTDIKRVCFTQREFASGKNPRFCKGTFTLASVVVYWVSLFLCEYTSQKRERESVVILLVSSVLDSLLFSLFFCRSFPLKSLVEGSSRGKRERIGGNIKKKNSSIKSNNNALFLSFPWRIYVILV